MESVVIADDGLLLCQNPGDHVVNGLLTDCTKIIERRIADRIESMPQPRINLERGAAAKRLGNRLGVDVWNSTVVPALKQQHRHLQPRHAQDLSGAGAWTR